MNQTSTSSEFRKERKTGMNKSIAMILVVTAICTSCVMMNSSRETMVPLMDGKTLAGWRAVGGGQWTVEDGVFVGRMDNSPLYGLLVSDKVYRNFTVKFKFKCPSGDSGFFIRTIVNEPEKAQGLQIQIAPPGSGTGGIYETRGRKWLVQPTTEEENKYLKPDDWNQMTITACGGDFVVHVNGIKTAELKDDPSPLEGHFVLQLHAGKVMQVMFKDIEIQELP